MPLSTPQSQAGIMNFYDAPAPGPSLNPKAVLALIFIFALVVVVFGHFAGV